MEAVRVYFLEKFVTEVDSGDGESDLLFRILRVTPPHTLFLQTSAHTRKLKTKLKPLLRCHLLQECRLECISFLVCVRFPHPDGAV